MTAHDPGLRGPTLQRPDSAAPAHFIAADRLVRPLTVLGLVQVFAACIIFAVFAWLKPSRLMPFSALGVGGLSVGALLLSGLGLIACLCMVLSRRRGLAAGASPRPIGGWVQAASILLLSGAASCGVLRDWPLHSQAAAPSNGFAVASALLLLATPCLFADRYFATFSAEQLPEVSDLRALLFLPVACLGATALLAVAGDLGVVPIYWARVVLSSALLLVSLELSLRVLGSWFLPRRDRTAARAPIGSIVAGMVCGRLLSPGRMAGVVRSQFGMDFSRSWALRFMRASVIPVVLLMLVFCWCLTGVTRIDLNERGVYERFGRVAAILPPGLHLVLPRPFGAVRRVEFGVIHSALITYADHDPAAPAPAPDTSTAEGDPPVSANRLWDSEQPSDVSYLVASGEHDQQGFQTVSVSVRVLWRIGLTDDAARAALYRTSDPDALVHALSGRLLADYFATRTLPVVLGENQGAIARDIRGHLQHALDRLDSGIDIVAVAIEAIHPPSGAAAAYRNVQAAEIAATSSIATERGRAETTASVAQRDAHGAIDDATAAAQETVSAAQVDLTDIVADDRPYRAASQPFLLERYFADVKAALADVPLEIVDHRLSTTGLPTIDLRPPGAARDGVEARATQGKAP